MNAPGSINPADDQKIADAGKQGDPAGELRPTAVNESAAVLPASDASATTSDHAQPLVTAAQPDVTGSAPPASSTVGSIDGEAKTHLTIRDILSSPVTLHMKTAAPLLRTDESVGEALEFVRGSQEVGRVVYFYVVDERQRLQGVVATRRLLLSSLTTKVSEIMSSRIIAVPETATVLEACEFFTLHKLLAFPVIDADRKVLGAVDVDLYTDEIQEIDRRQDSEDLFQLIGVHLTEAAQNNARLAFLGRFPWLICNVVGGMLSALIADAYQDISTLVVVAPFIALVTALSESVSIQSVSIALQMLHSQPPKWNSFAGKVRQELLVGLLLGAGCGAIVGLIAWLWKGSFIVGASLFLGIVGGVVASAGIGLSIPYVLKLLRRDPGLAAGPIALAVSDVVTLLCYFNLGRLILM